MDKRHSRTLLRKKKKEKKKKRKARESPSTKKLSATVG
jgi:hypothetical protein